MLCPWNCENRHVKRKIKITTQEGRVLDDVLLALRSIADLLLRPSIAPSSHVQQFSNSCLLIQLSQLPTIQVTTLQEKKTNKNKKRKQKTNKQINKKTDKPSREPRM